MIDMIDIRAPITERRTDVNNSTVLTPSLSIY